MTRRRAIRVSLLALLCLLLGAATTVGVAWRMEWLVHRAFSRDRLTLDYVELRAAEVGWPAPVATDWPPPGEAWRTSHWGWEQTDASLDLGDTGYSAGLVRAGLPLLALRRDWYIYPDQHQLSVEPVWKRWGWRSWRKGVERETGGGCLPDTENYACWPIFPGFAVDTGVYAVAWWVVMFAPITLYRAGRRRFRVSRGMCGACGYDLRGSNGGVCPECGEGKEATV